MQPCRVFASREYVRHLGEPCRHCFRSRSQHRLSLVPLRTARVQSHCSGNDAAKSSLRHPSSPVLLSFRCYSSPPGYSTGSTGGSSSSSSKLQTSAPSSELFGGPAMALELHQGGLLDAAALARGLEDWWQALAHSPAAARLLEERDLYPYFLKHPAVLAGFLKWVEEADSETLADLETLLLLPINEVLGMAGSASKQGEFREHLAPLLTCLERYLEKEYGPQLQLYRRAKVMADLRNPHAWFQAARRKKRRWLLHLGPTNSGKTHAAMQRLFAAPSGLYLSPLRLLAWEVYEKMRRAGIRCALKTGQECIGPEDATHVACTVEMTPIGQSVAVAVVDEVQLILDPVRGASWTRALLAVQAKELHLCGASEPQELESLLQRLAGNCGDLATSETHRRLVPLVVEERPMRSLEEAEAGDCIICFTRQDIMLTKMELDKLGKSPAVIYGSLPPAVRREQGALFNDPSSGRNILVASDAVGMGLNLDIRRVAFRRLRKFDGEASRSLSVPEIRQIAGRAGRFGGRYGDRGLVTCFLQEDLEEVRRALSGQATSSQGEERSLRAALFPTPAQLEDFSVAMEANLGESLPFAELLERFLNMAAVPPEYFLARADNILENARSLRDVRLPPGEKLVFAQTPVAPSDILATSALHDFASRYADVHSVYFPDIVISEPAMAVTPRHILELEGLHKICDVYKWLAVRFPEAFLDSAKAEKTRQAISGRIAQYLRQPLSPDLEEETSGGGKGSGDAESLASLAAAIFSSASADETMQESVIGNFSGLNRMLHEEDDERRVDLDQSDLFDFEETPIVKR